MYRKPSSFSESHEFQISNYNIILLLNFYIARSDEMNEASRRARRVIIMPVCSLSILEALIFVPVK